MSRRDWKAWNFAREGNQATLDRHREEQSDEAIQSFFAAMDCFAEPRAARCADPWARNDGNLTRLRNDAPQRRFFRLAKSSM
jgi:hypothetical protein